MFEIQPVEVGRRKADSSLFVYLTDAGTPIEVVYRFWILRGQKRIVLVDTGPPLEEARRRGFSDINDVDKLLGKAGVKPGAVDTVVLTHLHWDHAANAERFPNATFLAQEAEIDFFRSPVRRHPSLNRFFSHQDYLNRLIDARRIQKICGDQTIDKGLEAIRVGGHTPGSQILVIETGEGRAVIAGDAIPLHRNYTDNIPSGIAGDVYEAIEALNHVRKLQAVVLYTGHDVNARHRTGE